MPEFSTQSSTKIKLTPEALDEIVTCHLGSQRSLVEFEELKKASLMLLTA